MQPKFDRAATAKENFDNEGNKEKAKSARKKQATDVIRAAKRGDLDWVEEEHPGIFLNQYRTLQQIKKDNLPRIETRGIANYWLYGASRTGKSYYARMTLPAALGYTQDDIYLKPVNQWWDGYKGQPYVLIEDFPNKHDGLAYYMKLWTDVYDFPAAVKGSATTARPLYVVVTSNYSIEEAFSASPHDVIPLQLRMTEVFWGLKPGSWKHNKGMNVLAMPRPDAGGDQTDDQEFDYPSPPAEEGLRWEPFQL